MAEEGWQKIGEVSVDSGGLMIVDPSYELNPRPERTGAYLQFPINHGSGVIFTAGYGDGRYEVFAKIKEEKGLKYTYKYIREVKVVLIPEEEK